MAKQRTIHACNKIIEWCFYTLIITVTFSTSLVEITTSLMILAWLVRTAVDRDFKQLNSLPVKILGLFLLWTLLSCINSAYFKESFRGVFKWLEYGLVFVIVSTFPATRQVRRRFLNVVIIAALFICIDGFWQYFTGTDLIRGRSLIHLDYLRRISASFVHPNDFGVYLLAVSMILISSVLSLNIRLRNRLLMLIPAGISVVTLVLTKSRGALISFVAALLVLGALKSRKTAAVFLAVLLVVFIMLPYSAQERMFDLTDFKEGTTWERLMLWKGTINMIVEHPILGFGVNTYSRNFPKYKPPEYPDVRYSHNCYLHMASEIGIPGALIFLIFLVSVFMMCLRGLSSLLEDERRDLGMGLFACMVGFALNCVVDTHLYSVNLAVLFHLLLGFCFAVNYHAQEA